MKVSQEYIKRADSILSSEIMRADFDSLKGSGIRIDDAYSGYALAKELESFDNRVLMVLREEMRYGQAIPVNTSACTPGAATYAWGQKDHAGKMSKIGDSGLDLPTVDVTRGDFNYRNTHYGSAMSITTKDIRAAALMGKPLEQDKADAIRIAYNQTCQDLALTGDSDDSKYGLFNTTTVTPTVASTADAGGTTFANKTGQEMYDDITDMISSVIQATKNAAMPNTILMPLAQLELIKKTSVATDFRGEQRVINAVKSVYDVEFMSFTELEDSYTDASGNTYDQMVCYRRNPMDLEFLIGMPLTRRPGQWKGLTYVVPYEAELVGTVIRRPVTMSRVYGI